MSRTAVRGRGGNSRSIDVTNEQNNLSDNEDGMEIINDASKDGDTPSGAEYAWNLGGQYRDHVMQNLLHLGSNLGVYKTVPVPGKDGVFEKLFYRGLYAPDEVDAIRMLLIDQDSPQTRDLMIYCDTMKLVPKYLVPLFVQAVDEKAFAVTLIRLFLLLTKPLSKEATDAIGGIFKKKKTSKETVSEAKIRVRKELAIRNNAYSQLKAQLMFKEALVNSDVFVVLLKLLEDPIGKPSAARTAEDKFYIESVLTLINNLLRISSGRFSPSEDITKSKVIHNKLILILEGAFLDIILLMCHGVMEKDNNPWRAILVDIVHYVLSQREAKDLYRAFTGQVVASTLNRSTNNSTSNQASASNASGALPGTAARPAVQRPPVASVDSLLGQVLSERNVRQAAVRLNPGRSSRFAGQFVVGGVAAALSSGSSAASSKAPVAVGSNFTSTTANKGASGSGVNQSGASTNNNGQTTTTTTTYLPPSRAMIVTNPFQKDFERPDAPRRNEKRAAAFIVDDVSKSHLGSLGGKEQLEEDAKATKIVATFLNDFLAQGAFSELVFSIKEGWRRGVDDADGLTADEEMRYYMMMTTCLRFFRMHLDADMKRRDLATHGNNAPNKSVDAESDGWRPDLKPVTQCFDRMSFIRPVDFINRLYKVEKRPDKVMYLMELYTELVCYLRIMAESRDEAHNDISLGALYKIFYIRQEREDPLPFLVREWKSGTYTRRHLNGLITMAYEIMKTLDTARTRFREEARGEGLDDDGYEIKEGADKDGKPKKKRTKRPNGVADADRITYLVAALKFDPDEYLKRSLATQQAIKMYTSLLELYATNHPAVNHYLTIFMQRLYLFKFEDDYADISRKDSQTGISLCYLFFNVRSLLAFDALLQDPLAERDNYLEKLVRLVKQIVLQFGTLAMKNRMLFVEALFYPHHHTLLHQLDTVYDAKNYGSGGYNKQHSSNKGGYYDAGSDDQRSSSGESDFGDEFDEGDAEMTGTVKKKPKDRTKSKADRNSKGKEGGGKRSWSSKEDKVLKQKYNLYAGSYSVFDMIAADNEFKALGGNRSKTAIEKRVRQLNLHLSRDVDSSSDDDTEGAGAGAAKGGAASESEDEISFGSSSSDEASAAGGDGDTTGDDSASDDGGDEKPDKEAKKAKRRDASSKKDKSSARPEREARKHASSSSASEAVPSSSKASKKSKYDLSNFAAVAGAVPAESAKQSDSEGELDLFDDDNDEGNNVTSNVDRSASKTAAVASPPTRSTPSKSRKTSHESSPASGSGKATKTASDLSWLDEDAAAANSDDDKWTGKRAYKPRTSGGPGTNSSTSTAPTVAPSTSTSTSASTSEARPSSPPAGKLLKKRRVTSDDEGSDDGLW